MGGREEEREKKGREEEEERGGSGKWREKDRNFLKTIQE